MSSAYTVADPGIVQDGPKQSRESVQKKIYCTKKTELGENNIQIIMRILFIQALYIY
jgi:hypothetical protein